MKWNVVTLAVVLGIALVGANGLAVVDHDCEACDHLDDAIEAIDDHAEDTHAVDRARDERNGEHHQDEANDDEENSERADDRSCR